MINTEKTKSSTTEKLGINQQEKSQTGALDLGDDYEPGGCGGWRGPPPPRCGDRGKDLLLPYHRHLISRPRSSTSTGRPGHPCSPTAATCADPEPRRASAKAATCVDPEPRRTAAATGHTLLSWTWPYRSSSWRGGDDRTCGERAGEGCEARGGRGIGR